jgi:hypothetical protein
LEVHTRALDPNDDAARPELDAYRELVRMHRDIAGGLASLARQMVGYGSLPMGSHDEQAMMSPAARDAFARFVTLEQELADLLSKRLEDDRQMLEAMSGVRPVSS